MSSIRRAERALESINDGLELLGFHRDDDPIIERLDGVAGLMQHSDFLYLPDNFVSDGSEVAFDVQPSEREGVGIVPPSSYVFQTIPADEHLLPDALIRTIPHIGRVAQKETAAEVVTNCALGKQYGIDDKQPLFVFSDLNHPLTQAMVVVDMYSRLHDKIVSPVSNYELTIDEQDILLKGVTVMNGATLIARLLGEHDESGDTYDWLRQRLVNYADSLEGVTDEVWTAPPAGTPLAEAFEVEPLSEYIIAPYIHALGWRQRATNQNIGEINAAYTIGTLIHNGEMY